MTSRPRLAPLLAGAVLLAASAFAAPAPPLRVASLNLAADEVLIEILPPERIVAVTTASDDPSMSNAAGRLPKSAARFAKADLERVVALRPDLVVVSEYTDADFLRVLERSGMRVHRMRGLATLAGFRSAVLDLGEAVGARAGAEKLVARFDTVLGALSEKLRGAPRPRVLYWADGLTAGKDSAIGTLVEAAGGVNVAAELGLSGITSIDAERAFSTAPDVVLIGTWPGTAEALRGHALLGQLRAVQKNRVIALPDNLLVAVNHHAAEACWRLAHELHPDRVGAALP